MSRRTRVTLLAVTCLLASVIVGRTASSPAAAIHQANLTWSTWGSSAADTTAWNEVAALVNQQYPDIHVTVQMSSFADYFTKLAVESASNTMPCIVTIQGQRVPAFSRNLLSLDGYIKSSGIRLKDFDSTILQNFKVGGHQLALPYDFGPYVVYYNKTLFLQHNLALPHNGWTFAEFRKDATALTSGGMYGYVTYPWDDPWVWGAYFGGSYLNKSGTLSLTNPGFVKAFTQYTNLVHADKIAPQIPSTTDVIWDIDQQWQLGQVGMVLDGPWDMAWHEYAAGVAKFEFGIAPMPVGPHGSVTLVAGSGFGVSKRCKNPAAAEKAVSVMTGVKVARYLSGLGRNFPARPAQQRYWYASAVPGSETTMEYALQHAIPYPTTTDWDNVQHVMAQYAVLALNGSASPQSTLRQVAAQTGH